MWLQIERGNFLLGSVVTLLAAALSNGAISLSAAELSPGDKAPAFHALEATDGKAYNLDSLKEAKVVVICFTCNDCPVANAYQARFKDFVKTYQSQGVAFFGGVGA